MFENAHVQKKTPYKNNHLGCLKRMASFFFIRDKFIFDPYGLRFWQIAQWVLEID